MEPRPWPTAIEVRDHLTKYGPHVSRWRKQDALSSIWDVLDALDHLNPEPRTPDIERIRTIELGPDDHLVITLPEHATPKDLDRFAEAFKDKVGDRCIVVTANIDITAIRQGHDNGPTTRTSP